MQCIFFFFLVFWLSIPMNNSFCYCAYFGPFDHHLLLTKNAVNLFFDIIQKWSNIFECFSFHNKRKNSNNSRSLHFFFTCFVVFFFQKNIIQFNSTGQMQLERKSMFFLIYCFFVIEKRPHFQAPTRFTDWKMCDWRLFRKIIAYK